MVKKFHKQIDIAFDLGPAFFNDAIEIVVHTYGWSVEGTVDLESVCRYAYQQLRYWPMQEMTKLAYPYFEEEIVQAIKEAVVEAVIKDKIQLYCKGVLK